MRSASKGMRLPLGPQQVYPILPVLPAPNPFDFQTVSVLYRHHLVLPPLRHRRDQWRQTWSLLCLEAC